MKGKGTNEMIIAQKTEYEKMVDALPEYSCLYQALGGQDNFPRFIKHSERDGGWCDLWLEREGLYASYVAYLWASGLVRDWELTGTDADREYLDAADLYELQTACRGGVA